MYAVLQNSLDSPYFYAINFHLKQELLGQFIIISY